MGRFEVGAGSSLIYVPFRIKMAASRINLQDGTKKNGPAIAHRPRGEKG
jgi:hypothetical protein